MWVQRQSCSFNYLKKTVKRQAKLLCKIERGMQMKYIEIMVRAAKIIHGFDEHNKEIIETINETDYVNKLISVRRIQSISDEYILVTGSHGRVMYWEYETDMVRLVERLRAADLIID